MNMRRSRIEQFANAFIWATVIIAAAILLQCSEHLWVMLIVLATGAGGSMLAFHRQRRRVDSLK